MSFVCDVVVDDTEEGVRNSRSGSLKARPPPKTAPKPTREPSKAVRNTKFPGNANTGMSMCLPVLGVFFNAGELIVRFLNVHVGSTKCELLSGVVEL